MTPTKIPPYQNQLITKKNNRLENQKGIYDIKMNV